MMVSPGTRAARSVGLKLILLAVSFAAVGASVPAGPAGDPALTAAGWNGMKLLHLVLGMMGAGASLFFLPQLTLRWLGATVTCGLVIAVSGTPAIMWGYTEWAVKPFPAPLENLLAIALGILGVYIVQMVQRAGERFKADPWGFFAWFRSGAVGAPPAPPAAGDKGSQS